MIYAKALALGFVAEGARYELLDDPKAPSNYGPEAASKYIMRAREERAKEAAFLPAVATLTEVLIVDQDNKTQFSAASRTIGTVAGDLFRWFVSELPMDNFLGGPGSIPLFGFYLPELLMIGGMEALACHGDSLRVPFELWRNARNAHDTLEYITSAEIRKKVGLGRLCQFFLGKLESEEHVTRSPSLSCCLTLNLLRKVQYFDRYGPRPTS